MRPDPRRFTSDDSGTVAIEYGLIAALIAVVLISVLTALDNELYAKFTVIVNAVKG